MTLAEPNRNICWKIHLIILDDTVTVPSRCFRYFIFFTLFSGKLQEKKLKILHPNVVTALKNIRNIRNYDHYQNHDHYQNTLLVIFTLLDPIK